MNELSKKLEDLNSKDIETFIELLSVLKSKGIELNLPDTVNALDLATIILKREAANFPLENTLHDSGIISVVKN